MTNHKDALRAMIAEMRNFADVSDRCQLTEGNAGASIRVWADRIESALASVDASGEGLPEPDSLHERVEHYAVLVESFQRKMAAIGPMTPPESIAISGLIAAARDAVRLSIAPQGHGGGGEAWTEERLREVAKQRGWYVRDGASVPTDDGYRHPFEVCIPSRDLLRMLTTPPTPSAPAHVGAATGDAYETSCPGCGIAISIPPPSAPVVDDAMVERAARVVAQRVGENFDRIGEFAQTILLDTQRAALTAALSGVSAPAPFVGVVCPECDAPYVASTQRDSAPVGDRVKVLEMFLGRIFAAQQLNESREYKGWKISGRGSLNEVVAEAREYLNCPLGAVDLPALTPPAAAPRVDKPPVVVGTLGHVDHGKTALTAALTKVAGLNPPAASEDGLPDEAVEDAKDWAFIERCQKECGASYDDGDDGIFWTFDLAAMKKLRRLASGQVPEGWVMVPREPTDEMLNAYQEEQCRWSSITHVDDDATQALWVAMLAVAPSPEKP